MTDWTSGLLPEDVAADVLSTAAEESAVLALATRREMPAGVEWVPLVSKQPSAAWLDAPGAHKPYSEIEWSADKLVARELALTTFVEDAYLEDASWNPEAQAEGEMAATIARSLDRAVLFGDSAPSGFPAGGIVSTPVKGDDALDALDKALAVVEASGVAPTGIAAGPQIGSALRQAYREAEALPSAAPTNTVFGLPVRIVPDWDSSKGDAIVGAWSYLLIGVRQDIEVDRSTDATLTDGKGQIIVSAFEQDITVLRAHARFGCVIGKPVGVAGQPIVPFATASWSAGGEETVRATRSGSKS